MSKGLAQFIRDKMTRGYPHRPLLNCYKSYCQVPTIEMLEKWIKQYGEKNKI